MSDKNKGRYPDDPPDNWKLQETVHRMEQAWPILQPIVAILTNWKSWAAGVSIYAVLRSPDIFALLDKIAEVAR